MYCITCKPIVEKQIKDETAVKRININYMTDSVIVEYDSSSITKEEIKEKLEKSGYKFVRVTKWFGTTIIRNGFVKVKYKKIKNSRSHLNSGFEYVT